MGMEFKTVTTGGKPTFVVLELREYWTYSVNGHSQGWTLRRLAFSIRNRTGDRVFPVTQRCRGLESIGP